MNEGDDVQKRKRHRHAHTEHAKGLAGHALLVQIWQRFEQTTDKTNSIFTREIHKHTNARLHPALTQKRKYSRLHYKDTEASKLLKKMGVGQRGRLGSASCRSAEM